MGTGSRKVVLVISIAKLEFQHSWSMVHSRYDVVTAKRMRVGKKDNVRSEMGRDVSGQLFVSF